jgi:P4 family phage/plasmid primase-like protien
MSNKQLFKTFHHSTNVINCGESRDLKLLNTMSSDQETIYGSDYYESDYDDGYDAMFEVRRYGLEPARIVELTVDEAGSLDHGSIMAENTVAARPRRRAEKKKIEITLEPNIVEFFCKFVTTVGKKKCKRIMCMVNYYHFKISKVDSLPYPETGITVCSRLELESEMYRVSPEKYQIFLAELSTAKMHWLVTNHLDANRSFSEANVTALMYENYVGKYVCVNDGRSTSVWMFDETRWMEITPSEIWQEMSTSFIDSLRLFAVNGDAEWREMGGDIVRYMSSVVSRERIQRDLLQRLCNNSFQGKLNSRHHLIGMENGVYDLKKGKLRVALPMDYVSMTTGINYLHDDDEELREELDEILCAIFPSKRVRKFFIQSCASLLEGRNREKYVYVWWGKGNNAKSMMEKLLATALGDYSTVAATSLVTGKRGGADNASPQLSALEGKLAVFLQEPNPDETIKIGMIKELSGNDAITARALFKANRTFIPKFKLIIVCNTAIEIPNIDVAFTNRLIVIPFESTFRTKEDYRRREKKGTLTKYDHLMDATVARKIGRYAEVFFRMLVKEFEEMGDDPLHVPKRVRRATDEYIQTNNFSLRFIRECCNEVEKGQMNIKSLHSELKQWMNQHHGGKKVPNIDIFREEVANLGYDVSPKGIVHGLEVEFD